MILQTICKIVYYLLFISVSILVALHKLYTKFMFQFYSQGHSYNESYLQKTGSVLKKLPLHFAIIINEEDLETEIDAYVKELSKVVCWSVAVGIHYISIFDAKGILKGEMKKLMKEVQAEKQSFFGSKSNNYEVIITSPTPVDSFDTNHDPAALLFNTSKYHVLLTSHEESRWDVVHVARKFCEAVKRGKYTSSDVTIESINQNLCSGNKPDPDLAVVFGKTMNTNGFMPWQLRLTEILHVETVRNATCNVFISFLHTYAKTQQRFGA